MIIIVMGVSGSGKTAVGRALARRLGCPFYDGDDYHPPENIAKMSRGVPLDNDDRLPWLVRLNELLLAHRQREETVVLACSALRSSYREVLRKGIDRVHFVHLQGSFDLILQRMRGRSHHYMKAEMLRSQFEALEAPGDDEALTLDIAQPVSAITGTILESLGHAPPGVDHARPSNSKGEP